jgi:hypothetical protein
MGRNDEGQLGDGTETNRLSPVQIALGVLAISASETRSMFIKGRTFVSWLESFFTGEEQQNPNITGQEADPDGDGLSNYFEFLANFDPVDSDSRLKHNFETGVSSTLQIWPLTNRSNFEVQTSTNLSSWTLLDSNLYVISGDTLEVDLINSSTKSFFRIEFFDKN